MTAQSSSFPLNQQLRRGAAVRRPQEITCFSYDDQHQYQSDASGLRYYYNPQLDTDLSQGFEEFDQHDDSVDEHLDSLLRAIMEHEKATGKKCATDIMTWRGLITKIMSLPYDNRNGWELNATKFQDTIFLEENHSYKMANRWKPDRRGAQMSFWGYKFESLATLPKTWHECTREEVDNRPNERVSNKAQFCSIVKTGLGDTKLILGGEVDAVWDVRPSYVELKTSKLPVNERDEVTFERKLQKFWAQSFLLGVGKIVVGFRDDHGTLLSTRDFETQAIPAIAKRSQRRLWDGNQSIDFTAEALRWIKEQIHEGGVWRIKYDPKGNREITITKVEGEKTFLTQEFLEWRETATLQ
ncbi:RAI1 like PD-XK nuclease-domain-containing protein [Pyronema domesticum]|nr:RAI1 like PD-XK nuclease-domain-containing protein [Pyronema domesticum]